jgi:predicted PurR-regulated permease PerM
MNTYKVPFYAKMSLIFMGLWALIAMLYLAQSIVLPIIYSIVIAIVLNPLVDFFTRKRMSRIWSIALSLLITSLTIGLLGLFMYTQMHVFGESLPRLLDKMHETLGQAILWASDHFNIPAEKIHLYISDTKTEILARTKSGIGSALGTLGEALVVLILIPVYVFMILYYKPLLLEFISRLFGNKNHAEVNEVLFSTKNIIQRYLLALLLEAGIVATLNSIGLLIIGVEYAILLGVIGAILNAIPFIGGILSVVLPMVVAFASKSSPVSALLVLLTYIVIQFIDNHYIVPKIVASKVKINALISVIVVLVGGALWGVPGMFLSIPLTAILKVICDHIEPLKPWGFLLGDTMPELSIFKRIPKTPVN